jgi:RimJ/RimL family protein N-acetyltransferase
MVEHAPVEPSFNLLLQPLKTPRLVLVPVRDVDASWLQTMMELREVNSTTLIIPTPCPQGFAQGWIETAHRNNLSGNSYTFAVMLGDVPIGAIFLILNAAHAHAELGYFFEPSYWNRGYGSEASAAMLRFAFGDLHLNRVFAVYFSSNPASGRVMQKAGMVYEGCRRKHVRKCGVFFDLEHLDVDLDQRVVFGKSDEVDNLVLNIRHKLCHDLFFAQRQVAEHEDLALLVAHLKIHAADAGGMKKILEPLF